MRIRLVNLCAKYSKEAWEEDTDGGQVKEQRDKSKDWKEKNQTGRKGGWPHRRIDGHLHDCSFFCCSLLLSLLFALSPLVSFASCCYSDMFPFLFESWSVSW